MNLERQRFEKFAKLYRLLLFRSGDEYKMFDTQMAWITWQAAQKDGPLKLYLLDRIGPIGLDHYEEAVIAALSPERANEMAMRLDAGEWECTLIAESVGDSIAEEKIVLSSWTEG